MRGTPSCSTTSACFAHGTQNLAAGQRRSDGIAIRTRVRSEHEPVTLLDLMENVPQHGYAFFLSDSYETSSSFSPAPTILPLALSLAPSGPTGNTILARASAANVPPVHAGYILWRRASLRGFAPLPHRRHPHPPEPALNGHRRPHAPRSRPPSPMRGSASSPSTRVSISSRKASPKRPR